MPWCSRSGYIPFDPEIERSFHRQKNLYKQILADSGDDNNNHRDPPTDSSDLEASSDAESEMTAPKKLSDYSQPKLTDFPHLTPTSALDGVQFEIKPQFITMIERKKFSGAKGEDPNLHIADYYQYCNTIRQAGVTQDQIREILFPFSLTRKAILWFNGLNRTTLGITYW